MRIMAIDYGDARTGIAVSDPTGLLTGFSTVIPGRKAETVADAVAALAAEHQVAELVLGYPKNMNNTVGERALKSLEFGQMLKRRTGLPVVMWDERLTTSEAENILIEGSVRREDRKQYLDTMAAVLILQGYLDSNRNKGS